MTAIGKDGKWHDWDDLTPEEQQAWRDGMDEADRIWEARKRGVCMPTLRESLLEYERRQRLLY